MSRDPQHLAEATMPALSPFRRPRRSIAFGARLAEITKEVKVRG